jgi:crotonobetainyl-CoA:carnitine CoA-transferase CaiB-like acyl-CoA transferase
MTPSDQSNTHSAAKLGALSRFRVLDLTRARAGPTCVKQFADFGADVIRIESPLHLGEGMLMAGGRLGFDMQNLHRNTRSITLDLKTEEARNIFYKLVATADVVVENFRPDVKERLKIDYPVLSAINPKIILASISGFGQDGPYRKRPLFDQTAQGMSGLMSVTGEPGSGPMRAGAAVTDITAGFMSAMGILTALLEREVSGKGQWVQSSLVQAGVSLMDFQAAKYLMTGQVPEQVGNDHPTSMPTSCYACSDGYMNVACTGEPMWLKFCEALGVKELKDDARFTFEKDRVIHRKELNAVLSGIFKSKTKDYWVNRLNEYGVPCGPIYNVRDVFNDPQVMSQHMSTKVDHPELGEVTLLSQGVKLSRTPAQITRVAPALGEHLRDVLAEIGYSTDEIKKLIEQKIV